jgi:hypothetical protein
MENQNDPSQGLDLSLQIRSLERNQKIIMIISSLCLLFSIATTVLSVSTALAKKNGKNGNTVTLNGISQLEINEIADNIVACYNKSDMDGLYNIFGEYAKSQVSFEDLKKSMAQIRTLGSISNKSYIDAILLQDDNIGKWYQVNYSALYEKGKGTIKINFLLRNKKYEIVGYKFNIDNLREE